MPTYLRHVPRLKCIHPRKKRSRCAALFCLQTSHISRLCALSVDRRLQRGEVAPRILKAARPVGPPPPLVSVLARVAPDAQRLQRAAHLLGQPARGVPSLDPLEKVLGRGGGEALPLL